MRAYETIKNLKSLQSPHFFYYSAPPPPTDLRIEEQLAHALEISFLPPHPPNGILDQYRIRWTPHKKFNYRDQKVPAYQLECSTPQMRGRLCYRITGLEPEQEYEIQVIILPL